MKEPAVTDSTCLIILDRIGRLDILRELFEPVMIPPGVREEFGKAPDWLTVVAPRNTALIRVLSTIVDEGEAEAIALASEQDCLLILDDRKARRWAKSVVAPLSSARWYHRGQIPTEVGLMNRKPHSPNPPCPRCGATHGIQNGSKGGRPRWGCRNGGRSFGLTMGMAMDR